jgi:hypothetical protein
MHFHLPKPLHGWREFAGEVGIIVIGVLLALTFEAVADEIRWQRKVADARTQLRYELGHDLAILRDRAAEQACVSRRLDQVRAIITQASRSGRLPPVGSIGSADYYTWSSSVWESQQAAQTITHFPAGQIAAMGRVYQLLGTLSEANREERRAWLTLQTIVGPGRPVDPMSIGRLIEADDTARTENAQFRFEEPVIRRILANGDLGRDFPQIDPRNPPFLTGHWSICRPIRTQAPDTY